MLRNMALVGNTASATMPAGHRPAFEAGVQMLFQRWTALQLGVLNEWGGSNSREKAAGIQHEVLEWFYGKKSHEMLDLADLLDQAISEDFNIQAEDDSPYQVRSFGLELGARDCKTTAPYMKATQKIAGSTSSRTRAGTRVLLQRFTPPPRLFFIPAG